MRFLYLLAAVVLLVACDPKPNNTTPPVAQVDTVAAPVIDTTGQIVLVPLTGSGLRFDGAYRCSIGDLRYWMRFFERGSAAFVGGTEKYDHQLAGLLTIDVKSGWNQVHNCPVDQRN